MPSGKESYDSLSLKPPLPLMNAFLDADDLQTLTGYKRSADQIRWLETNGVPHRVNRLKRPVVRRDLETQVAEPALGPIP